MKDLRNHVRTEMVRRRGPRSGSGSERDLPKTVKIMRRILKKIAEGREHG